MTSPTEALVEESAEASLLVVGSRGRGSVLATLLGSVSFAVASTAQCPVVVVKEGCGAMVVGRRNRVVVGRTAQNEQRLLWHSLPISLGADQHRWR